MYRALTLHALRNHCIRNESELVKTAQTARFKYALAPDAGVRVWMNDVDVSRDIRTDAQVTRSVGAVAAIPAVRDALLKHQRAMADKAERGVVMDGRDIGTRVLPQAQLKIFMEADALIRAQWRFREVLKDQKEATLEQVYQDILARDKADVERKVSPLCKSPDAVVLTSSDMTIDQLATHIIALAQQRMHRTQ